jgi:DNA-binding beta-propeller fold protein YncE
MSRTQLTTTRWIPRRSRRSVIGLTAFGAIAAIGANPIRDAVSDYKYDSEIQARASVVCPPSAASTTLAPAAPADVPVLATTGQIFVSHDWARTVSIVELPSGKVTTLPAGAPGAHEAAVSPDGRWGVAADFGDHLGDHKFSGTKLAVFDLAQKRLARVIDLGEYRGAHDMAFAAGAPSRALVTTQTTQNVVEVDLATGQVIGATETRAKGSHTLAVSADGRLGFTANEPEGSLSRLDLAGRRFLGKTVIGPGPTEGIAVTPDGREVWMGFLETGEVRVADGTTGALVATIPGFVTPARLAMSPDGRRALVTDGGCNRLQVVDVATRRILGPITGITTFGVAKVLPDNRTAVVALLREKAVAMVDIETRRVLSRHNVPSTLDAAGWGPKP